MRKNLFAFKKKCAKIFLHLKKSAQKSFRAYKRAFRAYKRAFRAYKRAFRAYKKIFAHFFLKSA